MKDALHLITDAERVEREAPYRADLAAWPDMAQLPEPEGRQRRPLAAYVLLAAAIVLVAFFAAGCTETVERETFAPLTSPRPEARP